MKREEIIKKIHEAKIEDGKSTKIITIEAMNVEPEECSKIVQQLETGNFSNIVHEHEIRKGQAYGLYYQRLVTGHNIDGNRVTLAKLKFPTFDLKTDDGNIVVLQGKIS